MNRNVFLYGEKKKWFGLTTSRVFIAELTYENGEIVITGLNKTIEDEIRLKINKDTNVYGYPVIMTGREVVDPNRGRVHQTIAAPKRPGDKEFLEAIAGTFLESHIFCGYKVRGYRVMENGKKVYDIGIVKIEDNAVLK
jgi:hypothetical protein